MTTFRKLADDFWVAPQLTAEDFQAAAAMGIRTVINNRPDGEAPDQLADAEAQRAAIAAGLVYAHVPVVSGGIFPEHLERMQEVLEANEGPFLAYCRSGTRSTHLWALVEARRQPPAGLVESAARAGYDLAPMRPLLDELHRLGKR